ncbi:MAG: RNA polymerase II transcription factor B subunit 4 [Caeruleum heppii]|nr:MAG: RNA polymerase II transcription factor B subunit 4 [Caeruleum heppii]
MDNIDGSEQYIDQSDEPPPSLLIIILDTNPRAWSALAATLPLSKALANLLVFINAHLASNNANTVAVLASHVDRAEWLYPSSINRSTYKTPKALDRDGALNGTTEDRASSGSDTHQMADEANKYRPFRLIEEEVTSNLHALLSSTTPSTLSHTHSTMMAGSLTLALSYINRQTLLYASSSGRNPSAGPSNNSSSSTGHSNPNTSLSTSTPSLQSRIFILSASTDLASYYIPTMNSIFACQRLNIPIDVLKLLSPSTFLQQAADATGGVYLAPQSPQGILQYLMMAYLPDQTARMHLVRPTQVDVDFRAACFCHKRVVDVGFVCIFCTPPPEAICLTCGTHLTLGDYGSKPAVVPRKKKKRKGAAGRLGTEGSPTPGPGTPRAG